MIAVRGSLALLLVLMALGTGGCREPKASISDPKIYRRAGLEFSYPGNWKVTEDVSQVMAGFDLISATFGYEAIGP